MKNATSTMLALATLILCGAREARPGTLLNLVNPPGQNDTPYSLSFVAAGSTTDITFAGYQAPNRLWAEDISLTSGGGNLLGQTWTFTPFTSLDLTDAGQLNDGFGSGTKGLFFANGPGNLDQFGQVVSTVVGRTYTLDFLFINYPFSAGPGNQPSELIASESAVSTLSGLQGGTSSAPVFLLSALPVAQVTGTISGDGAEDYYSFNWGGGAFSASASITGAAGGASYLYSLGVAGSCNSVASLTLNSGDSFSGTISPGNLAAGQYCVGLDANSASDPNFSLTFNTPVGAPEPSSFVLLSAGLGTIGFVGYKKSKRRHS